MGAHLVHQLLERAARVAPRSLALVDRKESWDYATLEENARAIARALVASGVKKGDRVALYLEKSAWAIAAAYGVLMTGSAYVPLDVAAPAARNALILSRADVSALVTSTTKAPEVEALGHSGATLTLDGKAAPVTPADVALPATPISDTTIAYILHTSGSTGVPKGVAISHRNALCFVNAAMEAFTFGPEDRFALHAPLHFDLSVFDLYCAASAGGAVVVVPEFFSAFPKKMSELIVQHRVSVWNSVVSALALLLDKGRAAELDMTSVRSIFFSGERMPIPLLRRLREVFAGARLFNVYGQTEANSSMAYEVSVIPDAVDAALPLGATLPNFEVFLVGDDGSVLTGPGTGELCVRSGSVASGGYFKDRERSAEKFVSDPVFPETGAPIYKTGDLAKRAEDGTLSLVGRRDNMVKSRGYRIELAEVERAIEDVAGVNELAIIALPDELIGNAIVAFVTGSVTSDDLAAALAKKVPAYMVPSPIHVEEELPRTSSGKIDKQALTQRALARRAEKAGP